MRRNKLEIINEILQLAREGEIKTHLVNMANLNNRYISDLLDDLEEKGLIDRDGEEGEFKTTEKGFRFVLHYKSLQKLF